MNFLRGLRLLQVNLNKTYSKYFSTVIEQELTVQTFCDIYVNVPYNVIVKPLDVHKYHNCDILKIKLTGVNHELRSIKHLQDGNNIKIFTGNQQFDQNITCCIKAPIKANLYVTAQGNITTGFCNGSKLILSSTHGNIFIEKFQGETIELTTTQGDITMKGSVVAGSVKANILENGSIKSKRLQGLNAELRTVNGDITIDSSYCDSTHFETENGNLNLQNVHKNCKMVVKNGNITLNGCDGQLDVAVETGSADIQISRILADSQISIENGDLALRLSDFCQENTMVELTADKHKIDQSLKLIPSKSNDNTVHLMPMTDGYKTLKVHCGKGSALIQNASWTDMLKSKMGK